MKIIKIGLFGSLGVFLRYFFSFIFTSVISITFVNLIGVFLMALTNNLTGDKKDYFQTGFLGGFTSLSAIMVLNYSFLILFINLILGLLLYIFVVKRV